mgnify:CR=1 FL=1
MNEFKAKVYQTAIDQLKQKETLLAEERKNIIESILEEEKNSALQHFSKIPVSFSSVREFIDSMRSEK